MEQGDWDTLRTLQRACRPLVDGYEQLDWALAEELAGNSHYPYSAAEAFVKLKRLRRIRGARLGVAE